MQNLVIFGAPGCGKGTQSEKIRDTYNLKHISTGELLRQEIEQDTELGRIADSFISKGNLIPDDLIIRILEKELDKPEAANGVILDGFPRTVKQAEELNKMLEKRGSGIHSVVGLEVDDDELVDRLIKRGQESGRSDDNPEAIATRLDVYHNMTHPVCDFYKKQGKYHSINGSGSVDDVFDRIKKAIEKKS